MGDGALHEVSMMIGELKADMAEGHRQRDAMFKKLDAIANSVQQSIGQQALVAADVDLLKKKLVAIQPTIDEMNNLKQRGIGALAVVGLGAGGVSAVIVKFGHVLLGTVP